MATCDVGGPQRAVADPVADHAAEHRLVVVALGDQRARAARRSSARISLSVTNASLRWRPWKTTCSRTAAASFSAGRSWRVHRGDDAGGELLHEVVLEVDQDRLLVRVPVVDRRRLHPRPRRRVPASRSRGSRASRRARSRRGGSPRGSRGRGGRTTVGRRSAPAQLKPAAAPGSAPGSRPRGRASRRGRPPSRPGRRSTARRRRGDVGDVLEAGADPGRALQQRQAEHPLVMAADAGDGPERLRRQRPQHRIERLRRGVDAAGHAEDEVDPHRRLEDPLLEPADGADHVADVEDLDLERDPGAAAPARRSRDRPAAG